jgi:hypothetical protein
MRVKAAMTSVSMLRPSDSVTPSAVSQRIKALEQRVGRNLVVREKPCRPAGLSGLVLVAPAPAKPVGATERLQELTMHAYDDEQTVQQSIDQMLTHRPLPAELRRQIIEDSLSAGEEARIAWPKHGLGQDVSAGLTEVAVPVLVLAGDHDKVQPPDVLADDLLPIMPGTSMTVLEGTGHLSPLEVCDQVASHITAFTAQLNEAHPAADIGRNYRELRLSGKQFSRAMDSKPLRSPEATRRRPTHRVSAPTTASTPPRPTSANR